jgi:lysophospholipase L1-like esterase
MSAAHLVFLGDRHTAGVGDPTSLGWRGRIVRRLEDAGTRFTVWNQASASESSLELVDRWTHRMRPGFGAAGDCRAVLSFGVNDAAPHQTRPSRVSERRSAKLLAILLDEMTAKGIAVYVVGPAPVRDPDHRQRIAQLSARFAPICEERRVPYTSVFEGLAGDPSWMGELERGDGVNPAAGGYQLLAELLVEAGLVEWLSGPVRTAQGLPNRRQTGAVRETLEREPGPGGGSWPR